MKEWKKLLYLLILPVLFNCSTTKNIIRKEKKVKEEEKTKGNEANNISTININKIDNIPIQAGEIILLYTTDSCACTLEKCKIMKQELEKISNTFRTNNNAEIKFKKYNYTFDKKQTEKILREVELDLIPVVIYYNNDKKILYKSEWDINPTLLNKQIQNEIIQQKEQTQ